MLKSKEVKLMHHIKNLYLHDILLAELISIFLMENFIIYLKICVVNLFISFFNLFFYTIYRG